MPTGSGNSKLLLKMEQQTKPKEIPMLYSSAMVNATLAGRKTQTRRTTNLKQFNECPDQWRYDGGTIEDEPEDGLSPNTHWMERLKEGEPTERYEPVTCHYGKPGDVIWVRESFNWDVYPDLRPVYKADVPENMAEFINKGIKWKPSIHMPKDAARIWLEVVEVRAERLNEISEEDACAEGVEGGDLWKDYKMGNDPEAMRFIEPSESFRSLWKSINGPDSWDENPWVWVVTFKVISTTGKPAIEE